MPCYYPLTAWLSKGVNKNGNHFVVFRPQQGKEEIKIGCGQCIGCRLERSRQWALRCVHEASLYERNCFVTLTYDDEHLPPGGSLVKEDFPKFAKRLRKRFGKGMRYFQCGEYGENFARPHHHACLFNFDFPDKELWSTRRGVNLYRSKVLEELWPFGYCTIGDVTFESAAYVARYVTKKITGEGSRKHYYGRTPEFVTMSRRPGIGAGWYDQFKSDVYPEGIVYLRGGEKCGAPKFYDRMFEEEEPVAYEDLKERRKEMAKNNPDNTEERLRVRENVKLSRVQLLRRCYEGQM